MQTNEIFAYLKEQTFPSEEKVWVNHRKIKKDALYKPILRSFRNYHRKKFFQLTKPALKNEPKHKICKAVW
jgi:hypothetical protein